VGPKKPNRERRYAVLLVFFQALHRNMGDDKGSCFKTLCSPDVWLRSFYHAWATMLGGEAIRGGRVILLWHFRNLDGFFICTREWGEA
jgi:hypothetical protein